MCPRFPLYRALSPGATVPDHLYCDLEVGQRTISTDYHQGVRPSPGHRQCCSHPSIEDATTTTQLTGRNSAGSSNPGASFHSTRRRTLIHILLRWCRTMASFVTVRINDLILVASSRPCCKSAAGYCIQGSCAQLRGSYLGCSSHEYPTRENVCKHRSDASIGGIHDYWISWCEPSVIIFC